MNRRQMVGTLLPSSLALSLGLRRSGSQARAAELRDNAPLQVEKEVSLFEKEVPLFGLLTQSNSGDDNFAITQEAQWRIKRQLIKDKWTRDLLGGFPARVPLDVQEKNSVEFADYIQKTIDYATETDDRVKAYLLLPKPLGKTHAGIVAAHPSNVHGAAAVVGLAEDTADWWFGRDLVRRGYVVLAPDIVTAGERVVPGQAPYDTRPFYDKYPDRSIMGKMLWDHMRSVDVLLTLDFVDPRKIGAIGWSLGGHNCGFLAAFDDRVSAAVTDGGMILIAGDPNPFRWCRQGGSESRSARTNTNDMALDKGQTIYDHFSYMPRMRPYLERGNVPFDLHEIMALIAPRPYMDMNSVPGDLWKSGVVAAIKVRSVYELYGAEECFVNRVFDGPHGFRSNMRAEAYKWFERWLTTGLH